MGMFDKDKQIGRKLDTVFKYGDQFIVWGVDPDQTAEIQPGQTVTKTVLTVSTLENPEERFEVGTLSKPINDKAKEADDTDFPAVVELLQVPSSRAGWNDATVIQFVRPYEG